MSRRSGITTVAIPFAVCLAIAMFPIRDDIEVNGDSRLALVYAVVDHGTLAVESYLDRAPAVLGDLSEHEGHLYVAKPPLPSLLLAPVYALLRAFLPPADLQSWWWRWALTVVGAGVPFALLSVVLLKLATLDTQRASGWHLAPIAILVATPLVVYATVLFSHLLSALLLAALLLAVLGRSRPITAGLLLGALASTELLPAAAAAVLVAYDGSRAFRSGVNTGTRWAAVTLASVGVGAGPLALYQWAAFGSPFANMYASIQDPAARAAYATQPLRAPQADVALYVMASPQQGLLVFAPLLAIGAVAAISAWQQGRERRRAASLSALTFASGLIWLSSFTLWYDGSQYGPRYLVPFIPLLVWPLATWPPRRLAAFALPLALPQLAALVIDEPMLAPQASTYAEVARRLIATRLDPNVLGVALARLGISDGDVIGAGALIVVVLAAIAYPLVRRHAATFR